jgi:hypothetical protein
VAAPLSVGARNNLARGPCIGGPRLHRVKAHPLSCKPAPAGKEAQRVHSRVRSRSSPHTPLLGPHRSTAAEQPHRREATPPPGSHTTAGKQHRRATAGSPSAGSTTAEGGHGRERAR